jgi:hypothetical protein
MKDSVSFTLTMTFLPELIGETPSEVVASFGVVILARSLDVGSRITPTPKATGKLPTCPAIQT